jgi:hypothetical protein
MMIGNELQKRGNTPGEEVNFLVVDFEMTLGRRPLPLMTSFPLSIAMAVAGGVHFEASRLKHCKFLTALLT